MPSRNLSAQSTEQTAWSKVPNGEQKDSQLYVKITRGSILALCSMRHAQAPCSMLYALCQSFDIKLDQLVVLVGFNDFVAAGLGPGRKIG